MNSCLIPLLLAMFGSFMFLGVAQTETIDVEPSVQAEPDEVIVSTPATANAEAFILATSEGDVEAATQLVCVDNAEELVEGTSEDVNFAVEDLRCTDELNGQVSCSFTSDLGTFEKTSEIEIIFGIDETTSQVCEVIEMNVDGVTLE